MINYDFDKQEEGKSKLQYSNLAVSSDRNQTIQMFDHFKDVAYKTVKNPFIVGSVNLHPSEHLNPEDLENVAKAYLEKLGLEACPVFMTYHDDRAHKHLHFIVSRTDVMGKTKSLAGHFYKREAKEISNLCNDQYGFKQVAGTVENDQEMSQKETAVTNYSILRYAESVNATDPILAEIIKNQMSNRMVADAFPKAIVLGLRKKSKPESYLDKLKDALSTTYDQAANFGEFEQILSQHNIYVRAISDHKDVDKKVMSYGIPFNGTTKYVHESKVPTKFNYASITQIDAVKAGALKAYTYNQQKIILKRILHQTKEQSSNLQEFFTRLNRRGVLVDFHYSGEQLNGYRIQMSNTTDPFEFKSSGVDRNLSLANLKAYFDDQGVVMETQVPALETQPTDEKLPDLGAGHRQIEEDEEDPEERAKRKRKGRRK